MPSAESTAWWDDVQHLKPQAAAPIELVRDEPVQDAPAARPRRVTAAAVEPCLSREHAADFADAFDIDGAFGAPRRRFERGGAGDGDDGRVIVLERSRAREDDRRHEARRRDSREADTRVDDDARPEVAPAAADVDVADWHEAEAVEVEADSFAASDAAEERRMVRITGRPEAAIAPRRLRELEPRRRRTSAVERAASRPDRIALYAVLLGLFLVVLAAASSSAHP